MVNRVTLVGRLTRDPEVIPTTRGGLLANLRLATNTVHRDPEGNRVENTEYHTVVAFDRLAEICQDYLRKGRLVYLEGRLRTRSWDDKDGRRHFTTEVLADTMNMLGPRPADEDGPGDPPDDDGAGVSEPVAETSGRSNGRRRGAAAAAAG